MAICAVSYDLTERPRPPLVADQAAYRPQLLEHQFSVRAGSNRVPAAVARDTKHLNHHKFQNVAKTGTCRIRGHGPLQSP